MPPLSPQAVKTQFQRALDLQKRGQPLEALGIYKEIVAVAPRMAQAQFQIGRILTEAGKPDEALPHLTAARAVAPQQGVIWRAMLIALADLGNSGQIKRFTRDLAQALLPPAEKAGLLAKANRGVEVDLGGAPRAEVDRMIRVVLRGDKDNGLALAQDLHARFAEVSVITNGLATALGLHLREEEAIATYRQAINQDPLSPQIRTNFGRYLMTVNQNREAARQLRRAHELRPDSIGVMVLYARGLLEVGNPTQSLDLLRKAEAQEPDNPGILHALANTLFQIGKTDDAADIRNRLEQLSPEEAETWMIAGKVAQTRGDITAAADHFLKAIELNPDDAGAYAMLSRLYKFKKDDPLIPRIETIYNRAELPVNARIGLGFALGKIFEDSGQYDRVFGFLNAANAATAKLAGLDLRIYREILDEARELAAKVDLPAIAAANQQPFDPIFISGLPRSGTTLAEQILSSHSTVTGVGEATWIGEIFRAERVRKGRTYLQLFGNAPALHKAGEDYARIARIEAPDARRIADKGMWNHFLIGMMKAALPRSKIVMMKRDPRDNLLSIYKNQFRTGSHPYNSDLRALAVVYAGYVEMLKFWDDVFPGSYYTLDYDQLTAEPEAQTRALLDYCDLPFEEAVLSPHKTERDVRTLSVAQVRQPIYRSSVRSWERYRKDLAPLLDALKELGVAPPED